MMNVRVTEDGFKMLLSMTWTPKVHADQLGDCEKLETANLNVFGIIGKHSRFVR